MLSWNYILFLSHGIANSSLSFSGDIENNALTKINVRYHVLEMMHICSSEDMASGTVNKVGAPKLGCGRICSSAVGTSLEK